MTEGLKYGFPLPCLACKRQGWFELRQLAGCTIFELVPYEPMSGTGWRLLHERKDRLTFSVLCSECSPKYTDEKLDELVQIARAWKGLAS